ncbi:hypothetical protein Gotur_024068 [Gossypium turneri]
MDFLIKWRIMRLSKPDLSGMMRSSSFFTLAMEICLICLT